jgi:anti-anti-sigma factor
MARQLPGECLDRDPTTFGCHVIRFSDAGVIICVHGDVDCLTAPILEACLDQQLGLTAQVTCVEVALPHVSFLGARGINTLLAAAHTARLRAVDFRTTGCSARLLHLFDLVGVRAELIAID